MEEYGQALLIDVATVVSCIALLLRFGDLRFSHPATPYVVFHLHTVTVRLAGLMNGAPTLYSTWLGSHEPVTAEEIARAALYCDLAFLVVTLVWIFVRVSPRPGEPQRADAMRIDQRILRPVLLGAFVMGVLGLWLIKIPGVQSFEGMTPLSESNEWSSSSYLFILPTWFGLAVLGHIYYYGFRRWSGILLGIYLALMFLQGGSRYRVVVGLVLAATIWVERKNRRWPSKSMVLGFAGLALLFFPMKTIGGMIQKGASVSEIYDAGFDEVTEASEGSAPDHMFLDEFACALDLLDLHGKKYYGSLYLPLLTLPIPRAWWPDKPTLAPYVFDISTTGRPMGANGMITTYLGESYANFGFAGILLVPPVLAALLAYFRRKAFTAPSDSVLRFAYVLVSVNLIQVYRDGLQSIVVFTFVNMMPLVIVVLAHLVFANGRRSVFRSRFSPLPP